MAAWGLQEEDCCQDSEVDIWPDVWAPLQIFIALSTQWRVGASGSTGLDYAAVPVVLRMRRVSRDQWESIFNDLQVMESEALKTMSRNNKQ
jgi:Phage related hypothetical protein (DUF1799)